MTQSVYDVPKWSQISAVLSLHTKSLDMRGGDKQIRRFIGLFVLGLQFMCNELHLNGKGAAGFADELPRTADSSMNSSSYFN